MSSSQILDQGITSTCGHCKKKVDSAGFACTFCGFPQYGTTEQKKVFIQKYRGNQKSIEKAKRKIYIITALLVFVAGFYLFYGVLMTFVNLFGLVMILLGAIFGGLAYWSLKRPISSLTTALCVYTINILAELAMDPSVFLQVSFGNFVRIVFLLGLINGLLASRKIKKLEEELRIY